MKNMFAALLIAAVLGMPGLAAAEDGQAATSSSGHTGLFELISGENLCHGDWSFSTYYNKWDRRVQSDPVTQAFDPLWTDWDMDVERATVAIGYGVTDRIELALMVPYWRIDANGMHGPNASAGILNGRLFEGRLDQEGIGNVRLGAKFQIARGENWATAINAFIDAPTGDDDESVVTGETGYGIGFAGNRDNWVFNARYFDPGDSDFGEVSEEIFLGLGYGYDVNERLEWITELAGTVFTEDNGEHNQADLTSGVRAHFGEGDWAFNAALRVDLSDDDFSYTPIGGLIGLSYAPKNRFDLAVTRDGSGTGTVTATGPDGAGFTCGDVCESSFRCGATVALEAAPDAGSRFDGWAGDCAGGPDQTSISITLDADKTCSAKFVKIYDLTVKVVGQKHPDGDELGTGEVEIAGPSGSKVCTDECTMTYDVNTKIDLTAKPGDSSTFGGWSVDCSGQDPSTDVTLDGDKSCTATFVGPPRPCIDEPVGGDFAKCGRYAKEGDWSCDSATFTFLVDGYANGSFDIPAAQLPTDENEKKTPLCDLVNFMRLCPEFTACIAGREASGEAHCTAEERAARIAGFLQAQSEYPFFQSITADRYQIAPACDADEGTGGSVEVFLDR
ncbi:MAG: transporter [Acidobacteriota bacterium]